MYTVTSIGGPNVKSVSLNKACGKMRNQKRRMEPWPLNRQTDTHQNELVVLGLSVKILFIQSKGVSTAP